MPIAVTYSHRLSMQLIWRYLSRRSSHNTTALPKSIYGQAYVFRIALLSVSITTIAILLSEPIKKLSKKWSEKVWEKEFVVKKRLRNLDDADGHDAAGVESHGSTAAMTGGSDGRVEGEIGNVMPDLPPEIDVD